VSTYRFREEDAQDEILELLDKFGDQTAESEIIEIKGMIVVHSSLDPLAVIDKLKELVTSKPWQVRYVLRVLPVQVVVPTRLDTIMQAARDLIKKIGNESFRVTVEKRHNSLGSMQIVKAIADQLSNRVDLENPSWIILVQVLGGMTGVSVLRPHQIFSSIVEKRKRGFILYYFISIAAFSKRYFRNSLSSNFVLKPNMLASQILLSSLGFSTESFMPNSLLICLSNWCNDLLSCEKAIKQPAISFSKPALLIASAI
jgi:tRNA acetyltransferase TAN1